ncbi:hypothetical protein CGZ80_15025 [Rhodopirellula sp. MGV]|nr:hypothetical protein CGZ80_15025 [Rhodopirellula sp. MGV]
MVIVTLLLPGLNRSDTPAKTSLSLKIGVGGMAINGERGGRFRDTAAAEFHHSESISVTEIADANDRVCGVLSFVNVWLASWRGGPLGKNL